MNIAVVFSNNDLEILSDILVAGCVIVGDVTQGPEHCEIIRPKLQYSAEAGLADQVRELFESFERNIGLDSMAGFANNFYECSVAPICAFIHTLDGLLSDFSRSQDAVEVWFPSKYLITQRYSTYFMAEHESQGKRLYSREAAFLPYLEDVCKKHGATVKYKRVRFGGGSILQRLVRVAGVLSWRFCNVIVAIWRQSKIPVKKVSPIDLVAVTRSSGQTEFLTPFLAASGLVSALIAAETTLGVGRNRQLVDSVSSAQSNFTAALVSYTLRDLLSNYARALLLIVTKPIVRLNTKGIELNLDQAMTEVLSMWPDLVTYRKALHDVVRQLGTPRSHIMLTTEQKSPQAHADAWVAAQCGLFCVQVMQCDQHARPLPFPVVGDFFLADTVINAKAFTRVWGNSSKKVRYIGSFKACTNDNSKAAQLEYLCTRWCFFAQADDFETNCEILRALRSIRVQNSIEISVKLHPRDNIQNYRKFNDFTFLEEKGKRKADLFSTFDFAISFSSGVVLDLIFINKPFLLLRFGKWNSENYTYIDDEYSGNIFSVNEMASVMSQYEELKADYILYRHRFFENNEIISDVSFMVNELLELPLESVVYDVNKRDR